MAAVNVGGVEAIEMALGLDPATPLPLTLIPSVVQSLRNVFPDPIVQALKVVELCQAWRSSASRSVALACGLLDEWLELGDTRATLAEIGAGRLPPRLASLPQEIQADVIFQGLLAWTPSVPRRGPSFAGRVCEAWLGWHTADWSETSGLVLDKQLALESLTSLPIRTQGRLLTVLAMAWSLDVSRGAGAAASLLEAWLGIRHPLAAGGTGDGPNKRIEELSPQEVANFICVFTICIGKSGDPGRACVVLERFICASADTPINDPIEFTSRVNSGVFPRMDAHSQGLVIAALADAWRRRPQDRGVVWNGVLIGWWLGIEIAAYATEGDEAIRQCLKRRPFDAVDAVTQSSIIFSLSLAWRELPAFRDKAAKALIEAFIRGSPDALSDWPPQHLRSLGVTEWLRLIGCWTACISWTDDHIEHVADRVRGFIHQQLPQVSEAGALSDLMAETEILHRQLGNAVLRTRVKIATAKGDEKQADRSRLAWLGWHETFTNLGVLLRLHEHRSVSPAAIARPHIVAVTNVSPFIHPWAASAGTQAGSIGAVLWEDGTEPEVPSPAEEDASRLPLGRGTADSASGWMAPAFGAERVGEGIPSGAVMLTTTFMADGAVYWMASRRSSSGLVEPLADWESNPGAERRLAEATLAFDLTNELYLAGGLNRSVDGEEQEAFNRAQDELMEAIEFRVCPAPEPLSIAAKLLSGRGANILAGLVASVARAARTSRWDGQSDRVVRLAVTWLSRHGEKRLLDSARRDAVLDGAVETFLTAIQREFLLHPLHRAMQKAGIAGEATDLVIQPEGPLLVAPLGFVDCGGSPVFRRFASVTQSLSLALCAAAGRGRTGHGGVTRRALSAIWARPDERRLLPGLRDLYDGVQKECTSRGWEVWGLCDKPLADASNVAGCLSTNDGGVGVAVLGGHGIGGGMPGIKLSGGARWCGQGTRLSDVDLLVLASCSIGRLEQSGARDVTGLVAELAASGIRSVVAAKWPVLGDHRMARFLVTTVSNYLEAQESSHAGGSFLRARALNAARRELLDEFGGTPKGGGLGMLHSAAAFEFYGGG